MCHLCDELIQVEGKYKDCQHASSDETNEHIAEPVYHEPLSSRSFVLMKLKEWLELRIRSRDSI
jgi:hypothetical protein